MFLIELFPDYDTDAATEKQFCVITADNIRSAFEKVICELETIQDVTNDPSKPIENKYLKFIEEISK